MKKTDENIISILPLNKDAECVIKHCAIHVPEGCDFELPGKEIGKKFKRVAIKQNIFYFDSEFLDEAVKRIRNG